MHNVLLSRSRYIIIYLLLVIILKFERNAFKRLLFIHKNHSEEQNQRRHSGKKSRKNWLAIKNGNGTRNRVKVDQKLKYIVQARFRLYLEMRQKLVNLSLHTFIIIFKIL